MLARYAGVVRDGLAPRLPALAVIDHDDAARMAMREGALEPAVMGFPGTKKVYMPSLMSGMPRGVRRADRALDGAARCPVRA